MEKLKSKFCNEKLSLTFTGIGSLPFCGKDAPNEAVDFVFNNCKDFPFLPQLPHFKMEENMSLQFTEGLIGLSYDPRLHKFYLDDTKEDFLKNLNILLDDYKIVTASNSLYECENILDKYSIKPPYSNTINIFLDTLKKADTKPDFIKGAITGPFTLLTNFCTKEGKPALYNKTFIEIIPKFLTLKALFLVKEFKKAQNNSIPVIFTDEPGLSQIGSYPCNEITNNDITLMLKTVSDNIQKFGALAGVHCCGNTDWEIITKSGVNIINFDAYFYSKNVAQYSKQIENFLKKGGFLALGIIPTLDKEALLSLDKDKLYEKFQNSIEILSNKVDRNLILKQSFITPSCGCGSLSIDLAHHTLNLAQKLSKTLKEDGVRI